MNNKQKGIIYERELRNLLFERGIFAVRTAASGATRRPALDLVAVYKGKPYGFEVKYARKLRSISLPMEQFLELQKIKEHLEVFIAVRLKHHGWRFIKLLPMRTYPKEIIMEGLTFDQLIEYIKSSKLWQ